MIERVLLRPLSDSQRAALEDTVSRHEKSVTPAAARHLAARGIDHATRATFRVGVVATPAPGHNQFAGWLAIPYLRHDDVPLTIRFCCIEDHDHSEHHHGKYMSLPDAPARMFNVRAIHQADDVIHIADGEFGAMILNRVGLPAVAVPDASGWAAHHRRMLAGFRRVYVWGGLDDDGSDFVDVVCRSLRLARGVHLRAGGVVDTFLTGGAAALYALIGEA